MKVTLMLKDGGYAVVQTTPEMLGELANNIVCNGSETVHLMTRSVEAVGILVQGKKIGERVILTGGSEAADHAGQGS
ncbi:hypothetical protein J2TS6_48230 [Paenibacillus albilobatus]|uniref:Uncharacterized protein n=1 Tax=Paenibacillus albilobatus TaxID=2716884 RepID=A0A919XN28_9BACL|nr:hypothetical protein J2TS6_48230 [Paenibacillus albilobatus]